MRKHIFLKFVLLSCCGVFFFSSLAGAAEILKVGGGSAPMENIFKRIKPHFESKTGIILELVECGPLDAYSDLTSNKLDVASAGMMYDEWKKKIDPGIVWQLEQKSNKLRAHIIGTDYVTIYTNNSVHVKSLTAMQVKQIFTGKITNWQQVGGDNLPITVVLGRKVAGLMNEFQKAILENTAFTHNALYVDTANAMKDRVKATKGSITIGTLSQIQDKTVNIVEYPAPKRYIYMLWKDSSPKQKQIDALYQFLRSAEALKFTLSDYRQEQ